MQVFFQPFPVNKATCIRLLEILSPTPVQMDKIIRAAGAPAGEVLSAILELELAGRIERHRGNKISLV